MRQRHFFSPGALDKAHRLLPDLLPFSTFRPQVEQIDVFKNQPFLLRVNASRAISRLVLYSDNCYHFFCQTVK
jgi:hypothetical protein